MARTNLLSEAQAQPNADANSYTDTDSNTLTNAKG
jgi:hypothetical protein